jgi:Glycosyl transferase family 2
MMREHSAGSAGVSNGHGWLPPSVVRRFSSGHNRADAEDGRCKSAAERALRRAPAGPVLVASDFGRSDFQALAMPGRDTIVGIPEDPFGELHEPAALAAVVLDGILERTASPSELLGEARRSLRPDGVLVVTVGASGRERRQVSNPRQDRATAFPGQTLASLLFLCGFGDPEFHSAGDERLVIARRTAPCPPPERPYRLSVIMPVYNEGDTFEKTIELVLAKEIPGVEIDVIIVESRSTDGTREKVLKYTDAARVTVILEDTPRGKGHAVRRGLQAATGDFVLIQDADLEYDVDDYGKLLEPLRQGETGFVLGRRQTPDGAWGMRHFGQQSRVSLVMNLGHIGFLMLFNIVYQQKLRDPFTMYKVFRRDCLYGIPLECNRFDFDWELTAKLVRAGYEPVELPVSYYSRSFEEGKKIRLFQDPLTWVRACFRYRFSRLYSYS